MTKTRDISRKGIYCPDCGHWNIPERKSCEKCESALPNRKEHDLKTLIALSALAVSIIALIPAAFQAIETYQATEVHQADLRPLVEAQLYSHGDEKSIDLLNRGKGPAIITKIQFYKDGKPYFPYGNNTTYSTYINSGALINLAHTSWRSFIEEGITNKTALDELTKAWTDGFNGTTIEVDYEDTLGRKQKPYSANIIIE